MIVTVIVFLLIFSIVVIAHEFGHFLLAKKNGINVVEFAVGMGPEIAKIERNGTKYILRLLPIGGACMFEGEDGLQTDANQGVAPEGSFQSATVWARISTVIAGPLFNILLAFFLSLFIVGFGGSDRPVVTDIMEGYPAQTAGIQAGDTILRMDGNRVHLYREVSLNSMINRGEPIDITYERAGKEYETTIQPAFDKESGRYYIGLRGSGEYISPKGFSIFQYGFYEVRFSLVSTFKSLGMLLHGKITKDDVAGPVGIAIVIDDAIEQTSPYGTSAVVLTMLNIAILLSVNLGVLNILPVPALDGGRLVFLLIEAVRGKPISPEKEGMVHFIGFAALMILMVFVLFNDLSRLFR
ncbi:MAG: RIP metalloprotease RseP [Lachnospiraceae bacterium]